MKEGNGHVSMPRIHALLQRKGQRLTHLLPDLAISDTSTISLVVLSRCRCQVTDLSRTSIRTVIDFDGVYGGQRNS